MQAFLQGTCIILHRNNLQQITPHKLILFLFSFQMEDSSSNLPTSKIPKRVFPPLKIDLNNGNNMLMELKRTLSPPTSSKRSITFLYSFAFFFIACTMVFLFGNSRFHRSSEWLKSVMLKNRSDQLSSYFPRYLFHDNASEFSHGYALVSPERNSVNLRADLNNSSVSNETRSMAKKTKEKSWVELMSNCDIFDGKWVEDSSAPLYEPGSCHLIDESFNCYENGRVDVDYVKLRWQPSHCNIPRLDGGRMLKFLKGKRIVYVGDSLNRNMWESMVCLLRNSVKDKSRVFEASGSTEFKKEGAYSFHFPDFNVTVEYIRSAFLVQEWEKQVDNGSKKETLRLDLIENSYDAYKDADVLVFNTGNWWTHEKTSEGKGYYQEGNHVHEKLDVVEAFEKAMATWATWVETNVNPKKTQVFFRGYSFSHFSKGEWNSGGRCDDKEPIKYEEDLLSLDELNPPIPQMLDKSVERVKIPLFYLNVTRMTNYRRDAHPSLYRKPNMTLEERRVFLTHQDCSHWCLPGVPDTWNQLMFAQLLFSHKQRQLKQ